MGDSWDDDEWDADAIFERAEANTKEVRSEDEAEDSDEERRTEEAKRVAAARAAAQKPKPKPQAVQYDVPLKDKKAEKERLRKLEEERDQRLAADLFSGIEASEEVKAAEEKAAAEKAQKNKAAAEKAQENKVKVVKVDAFDKVELNTQTDVEHVLKIAMKKFEGAKAKNAAHLFLTHVFKQLEADLTVAELDTLTKTLAGLQKQAEKKKGNEKLNKNTKSNRRDEMDVVSGGGDWDDWGEDWDD